VSSILDLAPELFMALSLAAASAAGEEASWRWQHVRQQHQAAATIDVATDPRGPFRYTEKRWLAALKASGVAPDDARRIFTTSAGASYVPVAAERRRILALRHDIAVAGQVAYLQARANALALRPLIGRTPTIAELHAAHLLGAAGAARLVQGAAGSPSGPATAILQEVAGECPELLAHGGHALTAGELMALFEAAAARFEARSNGTRAGGRPDIVRASAAATSWSTAVIPAR
jgi:hypothetical protein